MIKKRINIKRHKFIYLQQKLSIDVLMFTCFKKNITIQNHLIIPSLYKQK